MILIWRFHLQLERKRKDKGAEKKQLSLEFKKGAADYAAINGTTNTLKKDEYKMIKLRTLQTWVKKYKGNIPLVDNRGGILLIYILFCFLLIY